MKLASVIVKEDIWRAIPNGHIHYPIGNVIIKNGLRRVCRKMLSNFQRFLIAVFYTETKILLKNSSSFLKKNFKSQTIVFLLLRQKMLYNMNLPSPSLRILKPKQLAKPRFSISRTP